MKLFHILPAALVLALCTSCSGNKGWSVSGQIEGLADGAKMALEANNGNSWYLIDSIAPSGNGKFSYKSDTPAAYADIMRLTLPGKGSIYFPVSNKDAVKVDANAATFGSGHSLEGTQMASMFSTVDSIVASTDNLEELQRKLVGFITTDTTGVVAYYTVRKAKNNTPVFNPNNDMGNRAYGAAAQVFATYQPLDNRGLVLKQEFFAGRRALGKVPAVEPTVIEADETGLIDIVRYDNKGVEQSLAKLAEKKDVIILSFTDYSDANSPAFNAMLYDIYNKYKSRGLEIYQLSFDGNEVAWKEAANNLPWITVWNAPTDGVNVVMQYNVNGLPLTYIISRDGEIGARVENPADIEKTVQKYL